MTAPFYILDSRRAPVSIHDSIAVVRHENKVAAVSVSHLIQSPTAKHRFR